MDQFTVPQFIEHKPKVVGPLTFQQFIFIGIAGAVCFFLYFTLPFYFFVLGTIVIMLGGVGLAFGKAGGRPLPRVLKNLFVFTLGPKIYLWKKKTGPPPKLIETPEAGPEEIQKTPVPTMVGKSHLKELSTKIETKTK